jgi:hypothetical protein
MDCPRIHLFELIKFLERITGKKYKMKTAHITDEKGTTLCVEDVRHISIDLKEEEIEGE